MFNEDVSKKDPSPEADERKLTDYLLGRLSEEEEIRLENGYLAAAGAQDRLLVAEDELIEAYVRGELSPEDRERMETGLLASPDGRQKFEVAQALIQIADESEYPKTAPVAPRNTSPRSAILQPRFLQFALAAAALLLVVGIWSIPWRQSRQVDVRNNGVNGVPQAEQHGSGGEPAKTPEIQQAPLVASIVLNPGLPRGNVQPPLMRIAPGTSIVRITVVPESEGRRFYRIELRGPGEDKRIAENIPVKEGRMVWELPASGFQGGEYTLWLADPKNKDRILGETSFAVEKK